MVKKTIVHLIISFLLIASLPIISHAKENNNIIVKLNGEVLNLDVKPVIIDGNTLVPLRGVFESLCANVEWNEKTQTAIVHTDKMKIELPINKKYAVINGEKVELSAASTIIKGSAMVPISLISESFGEIVNWDQSTSTVLITTKDVRDKVNNILSNKLMGLNTIIDIYGNNDYVILEINKFADTYDYDNDGLLDYYELYRYFTDPENPDTDGDGKLDGEWEERKEYTYTITVQIRLVHPYNLDYMTSHPYQDVKIIEETDKYLDCEITLYPFNKYHNTYVTNDNWQEDNKELMKTIEPGKFNDWNEEFQKDLIKLLKDNGIEPDKLTDKELVIRVVDLMNSNYLKYYINDVAIESGGGMHGWYIDFNKDGKPFFVDYDPRIKVDVNKAIEELNKNTDDDWTYEDFIKVSSSATQMFYYKTHGSCSSTSAFYANIFQALGIPTKVAMINTVVEARGLEDYLNKKPLDKMPTVKELVDMNLDNKDFLQYEKLLNQKFKNNTVQEYWNNNLKTGVASHIINMVYLGNKWVPFDVAGSQRMNSTLLYCNGQILFFKLADYDFANFSIRDTKRWKTEFLNNSQDLIVSKNFKSNPELPSTLNVPGYIVYDIQDDYGANTTKDTMNYINTWSEHKIIESIPRLANVYRGGYREEIIESNNPSKINYLSTDTINSKIKNIKIVEIDGIKYIPVTDSLGCFNINIRVDNAKEKHYTFTGYDSNGKAFVDFDLFYNENYIMNHDRIIKSQYDFKLIDKQYYIPVDFLYIILNL